MMYCTAVIMRRGECIGIFRIITHLDRLGASLRLWRDARSLRRPSTTRNPGQDEKKVAEARSEHLRTYLWGQSG